MTIAEILDPEVESKIAELKSRVEKDMKPTMKDDKNLFHRFLVARDYNVDQAEIMLKKHLQWRKDYKTDAILTEKPDSDKNYLQFLQVEPYIGYSMIGYDKDQCPVTYWASGNTDWKGIQLSVKLTMLRRYFVKIMEEESAVIENQSKKLGRNIKGVVSIMDLKNFSFAIATDKRFISELMNVAKVNQDNYPERLKQVVLINVPSYFTICFNFLKTVLAASILNKIQVYGSPEEYQPALLKIMDASDLPAFLGGKKTDPDGDPLCKSFIRHGGQIPSKFHVSKAKSTLAKCKEAKKLVVPRAAFSEIELNVKEANSVIEWEFETKTRDIGFGLFFKELEAGDEEKIVEIVSLQRLDTENFSETGMFKCDKPGTYILLFDNSYSWMRSKEIYYKVTVKSPKDHEKEMAS
ncbi:retinal-binding protein [Parasteatoda tepidariorum]|uniref:retinal-binding protein n=1 Tax=Parasteatoda tepidariorum TaxID=114398 RepID=UPI00077FBFB1|nr:retinal-binding protein isoform X1 [Parasteatoda tepidariorum]XP_015906517.1 retinal-binding protein isoform X1 [Parasteatoda tepidariorum]XP_015906518.1 retinal-binding protein isoform X1 [Parasteatoda tepidariorum]